MLNRGMVWRAWIALGLLAARASAVGVGDPAPELRADRWYNAPGTVSLEQYRGQVVVVEFWATYCHPCHEVQPKLAGIHRKWAPQGVVLISMSDEPESVVTPFLSKQSASYILSAGGDTPRRYGISGIPAAFVIDRTGAICWRGNPHEGGFEDAIERAVRSPSRCVQSGQSAAGSWRAASGSNRGFEAPEPAANASASFNEMMPAREQPYNRATARSAPGAQRLDHKSARTVKKAPVAKSRSTHRPKTASRKSKGGTNRIGGGSRMSRAAGAARKPGLASAKARSARLMGKKSQSSRKPVKRSSRNRK